MKHIFPALLVVIFLIKCNKTDTRSCCTGAEQLAVVDSSIIAVSDIFTPNGDGINDIQFVNTTNIFGLKFTIFSKSGTKVFETTNMAQGWDGTYKGKMSKEKEYSYVISATTMSGKTLTLSGNICLIRDNCAKGPVENCFFSTQFNGSGFDRNIPSGENIKMCK